MRTIDGEPETQQQRQLARQLAPAIAGTSPFTEDGVYTPTKQIGRFQSPSPNSCEWREWRRCGQF